MQYRAIGQDLPEISTLSLGSWNTFSRISFEENLALVRRALDLGVNLFDVGYYWDKPHTEVIFGRVMQVVGAPRSAYVLVEKLWLWDYPQQSFEDQLKASLLRLGVDEVDLISVSRPLPELEFDAFCDEVVALVAAGLARGWAVTNWEPQMIRQAQTRMAAKGLPGPRLVQVQYNAMRRGVVEAPEFDALFAQSDIRLCAANVLEGGILGGHLDRDRVNPSEMARGVVPNERNICRDSGGVRETIRERQADLARIAATFGLTPAQAAIAFTLSHPALATVLAGVTRIGDLEEDVAALDVTALAELRAAMASLTVEGAVNPKLFSPTQENA